MKLNPRPLLFTAIFALAFFVPFFTDPAKILRRTERPISLPLDATRHILLGVASWYGKPFHGRLTANGESYDMYRFSAAHKTLPLGTYLKVKNLSNGKSVIVKVNDRGPYIHGRSFDLSYAAARELGYVEQGLARVEARVLKVRPGES